MPKLLIMSREDRSGDGLRLPGIEKHASGTSLEIGCEEPHVGSTMELITLSIAGSTLLLAAHWFAVIRDRFFGSR